MHPFEEIDLQDCPLCQGAGCLEEEGGWCVYAQCLDCGCTPPSSPTATRRNARRWPAALRATGTWARSSIRAPAIDARARPLSAAGRAGFVDYPLTLVIKIDKVSGRYIG